jgi:hypothetical protein
VYEVPLQIAHGTLIPFLNSSTVITDEMKAFPYVEVLVLIGPVAYWTIEIALLPIKRIERDFFRVL